MNKMLFRSLVLGWLAVAFWFTANEAIKPGYTYNVWINVDELANALLYGDNETISARLGRLEKDGSWFASAACEVLDVFFGEEDHCVNALGE